MPKSIRPIHVNHINVLVEELDGGVVHINDLYGGHLIADISKPNAHCAVVDVGNVLIQVYAPLRFDLNMRHGPHYLGVEYQVDMSNIREILASREIRLARQRQIVVHTHPADCYGVSFEFYGYSFHDPELARIAMPGTASAATASKLRPPEYWRDEHPLGLTGLAGYSMIVSDIESATSFFVEVLSGRVISAEDRPAWSARAVILEVADCTVELLAPSGDGLAQRELEQMGQGIRSTVFGVCDIDRVTRYLRDRRVELIPGAAPNRLAVPPELNLGLNFEFLEEGQRFATVR
jgi:hypothetical protein